MFIVAVSCLFVVVVCGPQGGHGGSGGPGGKGGPGRHHGPPPPPFLKDVNQTVRQEYFKIVSNENETIAQQKQDVSTWASKYGLTELVTEFNANQTAFMNELKQNITNLIAQLPNANSQLESIMSNESLTRAEQKEQIETFRNQSRQVADVLFFLPKVFMPKPPRGPGGFGGPGGADYGSSGGKNNQKNGNKGRGGF